MTNYRSQLTGIWIVCAVLFLAFVGWKARSWITAWRTNYVVGTFQGTFSLDETRVRIPADKTGLVVAKVEGRGGPIWMRSFSGLSPGRAAPRVILPDSSVVVAGVFERELRTAETPDRLLLRTDDKQGVFTLQIGSNGRTTSQRLLASGEEFATPTIKLRGDRVVVDVRSKGSVSVGGKAANGGIDSPTLHLELSPSGEIMRWEGTGGAEHGAPSELRLAPSTTCEVCRWLTPKDDPNCAAVHSVVCDSGTGMGDPWCCSTGWDRLCMNEALGPLRPSGVTCTCEHGPLADGHLLPPLCPGPTLPNCVSLTDDGDSYCGWSGWDDQCIFEYNGCPLPH
jgi:hypothetical protein